MLNLGKGTPKAAPAAGAEQLKGQTTDSPAPVTGEAGQESNTSQIKNQAGGAILSGTGEPVNTGLDTGLTAQELGDPETLDNEDSRVDTTLAEIAAADSGQLGDGGDDTVEFSAIWSSHPIQNYSVGRFHFTGTVLTLTDSDDAAEFEQLLKDMPLSESNQIKKIDVGAAEDIIRSRENSATKQFDSSLGKEGLAAMQKQFPTIGTAALESMERPVVGFGSDPAYPNERRPYDAADKS